MTVSRVETSHAPGLHTGVCIAHAFVPHNLAFGVARQWINGPPVEIVRSRRSAVTHVKRAGALSRGLTTTTTGHIVGLILSCALVRNVDTAEHAHLRRDAAGDDSAATVSASLAHTSVSLTAPCNASARSVMRHRRAAARRNT